MKQVCILNHVRETFLSFVRREYSVGVPSPNCYMKIAFGRDPLAILKHPAFWEPSTYIDFMGKLGCVMFEKIKVTNNLMWNLFKDTIIVQQVTDRKRYLDFDIIEKILNSWE